MLRQELRVPGSSQGRFGMLSNGAQTRAWEWRAAEEVAVLASTVMVLGGGASGSDDGIDTLMRRGLRASSLCLPRGQSGRRPSPHTGTAVILILDFQFPGP